MKKKNIIIILLFIIIINVFFYFSGIYEILFFVIRDNIINKNATYYEKYETRIDYFNNNKNDLDTILNFMNNNKMIEYISRYSMCPSTLHEYVFRRNYILCANDELSEDMIKNIDENIINKIYNIKLKSIFKIIKIDNGKLIGYDFRLISTNFYRVQYVYCLEYSGCNTESNYEELANDGYVIKNKIDKNWYTSYTQLPDW